MALDRRRSISRGKKNSGQIFCIRQVYFTKSCQQIWVRLYTNLLYHWYITSEVKQYYEALFLAELSREARQRSTMGKKMW